MSDNCFDTTGAASAGLPGLTVGEQIGGMWKSIAENRKIRSVDSQLNKREQDHIVERSNSNLSSSASQTYATLIR